jgi:glutamate---cysteine ligase / carboxylate-amine ligase
VAPEQLTVGIEEEYLLLDPATGAPVPAVDDVRRIAAGLPALDAEDVEPELLKVQVEVATPVCRSLDEAGGHLLRLRSEVAGAAEQAGCVAASVGAASRLGDQLPPASDGSRYQAMHDLAPRLVDEMLLNGLHVHVGIPSDEDRIRVLNALRAWLPVLTALGANSPYWDGVDSGFASWRTVHFSRWPVSGPPPSFTDPDDYERRVSAIVRTGALVDRGQLYWQARLSHRYPTVEIRVADAQLRVSDSVLMAGLLRGLVLATLRRPSPETQHPNDELLRAAVWQAARDGLAEGLLDPVSAQCRPARDEVARLHEHVGAALDEFGDGAQVSALLTQRLEGDTGAGRQRQAFGSSGLDGVLKLAVADFVST